MFTLLYTGWTSLVASAALHFGRALLLIGFSFPTHVPPQIHDAPVGVAANPAQRTAEDAALAAAMDQTRYRLAPDERDRYRRLFAAVDRGDWREADAIVPQIRDRRLMGHVLAAHYLAPEWRPATADLRGWLDLYGDLPEADSVYALAQSIQSSAGRPSSAAADLPRPHAAPQAEAKAPDPDSIGSAEPHTGAGDRALSRFFAADDKGALSDAVHAIGALRDRASTSLWIAGLAAWRMGDYAEASQHFIALADSHAASGWMLAAGAYWAGRADELRGATESAEKWFAKASRYRTTFYGMLAMRKLGLNIADEISTTSLNPEHLDALAETPAGYRAIALLEIGRRELAAQELERIDPSRDPKLEEALIVVSDTARLGDVSFALAQRIATTTGSDAARFPIPPWQPRGGFRIDPALVYAFARQESGFDPKAVSPVGATGLMQLMPHTAESVSGNRRNISLFDPATNLELGQRYLGVLMEDPGIGENLLLVALAYNSGSTNLAKFRHVLELGDPLLAIESVSVDETRGFIERVLANYWIYRAKLGGDTQSLTDLANGRWPHYRWDDASNPWPSLAAN